MSNNILRKGDIIKLVRDASCELWEDDNMTKARGKVDIHDNVLVISIRQDGYRPRSYGQYVILEVLTSRNQVGFLYGTFYGPHVRGISLPRWKLITDEDR